MQWGHQEEFLESIHRSTGIPPTALRDKPEKAFWMAEYLKAFEQLSSCRSYGMSAPNPISFEAIDRYAYRYEIDDFDEFFSILNRMDSVYIGETVKKSVKPKSVSKE